MTPMNADGRGTDKEFGMILERARILPLDNRGCKFSVFIRVHRRHLRLNEFSDSHHFAILLDLLKQSLTGFTGGATI